MALMECRTEGAQGGEGRGKVMPAQPGVRGDGTRFQKREPAGAKAEESREKLL